VGPRLGRPGTIESVKAVSELYAPLTGEVVEVNSHLAQHPDAVNADPHGSWMITIKVSNDAETADLLDANAYTDLTK
jgi:glycine cleavage system H protein